MAPCKICEDNEKPNCGNDWCHTRDENEKEEWISDCTSCGAKDKTTWTQAIYDGCPTCGSHKTSIYHESSEEK